MVILTPDARMASAPPVREGRCRALEGAASGRVAVMEPIGGLATWSELRHRNTHAAVIATLLAAHLLLHYAAYIPGIPDATVDVAYSRFRAVFDMGLLILVIYSGSMFRLKGSALVLGVTSITLVPLLIAPEAGLEEEGVRDQAIEVGLVLLIGALMVVLQEFLASERESRERLNDKLDITNRQLSALNRMAQRDLNLLFYDLRDTIEEEQRQLSSGSVVPSQQRYNRFLRRLSDIIGVGYPVPATRDQETERALRN